MRSTTYPPGNEHALATLVVPPRTRDGITASHLTRGAVCCSRLELLPRGRGPIFS
jgi:hypothetical protein